MYMKIRGYIRNKSRQLRRLFKYTVKIVFVSLVFAIVWDMWHILLATLGLG